VGFAPSTCADAPYSNALTLAEVMQACQHRSSRPQ